MPRSRDPCCAVDEEYATVVAWAAAAADAAYVDCESPFLPKAVRANADVESDADWLPYFIRDNESRRVLSANPAGAECGGGGDDDKCGWRLGESNDE